MVNGNNISLKRVLWQVMDHPLATDLTYDIAAEYALEVIELLGSPLSFIDITTDPPLVIENNKVALPTDMIQINGIRLLQNDEFPERSAIALRYATDAYHNSANKNTVEEFTYTVQQGVLFTSFEKGCVEVSYKAIPTDDEGYPMIPNNRKYRLAVEYYILYKYLAPLYDIGKVSDKAFNRISQEKSFYVGAAQTSMQLQGMDHLESMLNGINRLIINSSAHKNFYKGSGEKERIKKYY
jgi:hypothetical protein